MRQQKLVVDHMCMDGQVCMAMAPFARATGSHYYLQMRPGLASGTTSRQAIMAAKSIQTMRLTRQVIRTTASIDTENFDSDHR